MSEGVHDEWSGFWRDIRHLHWGAVDEEILTAVADVLGWGPERSLLEIGGGRGLHSKRLWESGRAGSATVYELAAETRVLVERAGIAWTGELPPDPSASDLYDIVWSNGVVEHYEGQARQEIVDDHFRRSRDWVVVVAPRANWQRRIFRPRHGVPDQWEYSVPEMRERLATAARNVWGEGPAAIGARSFCPLFAVRHIPDGVYPIVAKLAGWALPDGLVIGWARRSTPAA